MDDNFERWKRCFVLSATSLVQVVQGIDDEAFGQTGLGVWTVRDLIGHASRAMTTIESYLANPGESITISSSLAYYELGRSATSLGNAEAIAQRGRDAGQALGDQPALALESILERTLALLKTTPANFVLSIGSAGISFEDYLPTRTFELTVHTLDLVGALGVSTPESLEEPISACLELAGALAGVLPGKAEVLLALTGRRGLPNDYSVV